jgi:hypothetical protein
MIRLYSRGGSSEISIVELALPADRWSRLRALAIELLRKQGRPVAADLLETIPFDLWDGTNGFGDEFTVLHLFASTDRYLEAAAWNDDPKLRAAFEQIAKAVSEAADSYVRFVAVELDRSEPIEAVATPNLAITSDVVERALNDAEHLISTSGATSGVDRVHTALHGHLIEACKRYKIAHSSDAGITELFKKLREEVPSLRKGNLSSQINRVVRAFATILDSLDPVRNHASMAHPNEGLLEPAEAVLVINSARTILQYLDTKLG